MDVVPPAGSHHFHVSVDRRTLPAGLIEAAAVALLYFAGELTRGLAGGGRALAERHAASIVHIERRLHLFDEAAIQRAIHHVYALSTLLGYAYLTCHLAGTAVVLVWVYRRRRHAYRRLLCTLVLADLLAVIGYALYPTAPPRLAGVGIADTVSGATSINLASSAVSRLYNPYAAVPSMHIGFSVLVGATVWRLARRRLWRLAGLAYPLFVLLVIVATGNHFFLDAAAGVLVAVISAATVTAGAATLPAATSILAGRMAPRPDSVAGERRSSGSRTRERLNAVYASRTPTGSLDVMPAAGKENR